MLAGNDTKRVKHSNEILTWYIKCQIESLLGLMTLDFGSTSTIIGSMEIKQWNVMGGNFHVNWNEFSSINLLMNISHELIRSRILRTAQRATRGNWKEFGKCEISSLFCVLPIIVTSASSFTNCFSVELSRHFRGAWINEVPTFHSMSRFKVCSKKAETVPVATLARTTRTHERAHESSSFSCSIRKN